MPSQNTPESPPDRATKRALDVGAVRAALEASWSDQSSTLWTPQTPAAGQCGVSALVVQDWLGGEIRKTRWHEIWHFYNWVGGQRLDVTAKQFDTPLAYEDRPASRDEAFADTNAAQYAYLSSAVRTELEAET